ncbi:MAG: zinc ribbon domain-containing protein [Planctomycetota bacterium]|nr:MAG: zinc ribbon domain-containing protein [Planctomycetota bacterium]
MPTYDYECDTCGHTYELFQSITAKPIKKCPECGNNTAKRLIGAGSGIIFKGSGFYQTDYRSERYKKAAKAETDTASENGQKDKTSDKKKTSESKKTGTDN